jgi:hypothetical protein
MEFDYKPKPVLDLTVNFFKTFSYRAPMIQEKSTCRDLTVRFIFMDFEYRTILNLNLKKINL